MKNVYIIGAGLLAVALLVFGLTSGYYSMRIDTIKANHATFLAQAEAKASKEIARLTKEKVAIEKTLGDRKNELDNDYRRRVQELNTAVGNLASIRLRDPHSNGQSTAPTIPGSAGSGDNTDPGSGQLSERTSQFLLSQATRADTVVERLRVCRDWVQELEKRNEQFRAEVEKGE
jgi:hypothetical protein